MRASHASERFGRNVSDLVRKLSDLRLLEHVVGKLFRKNELVADLRPISAGASVTS